MTAGRMGKYIMALTAAGIDCTKVNDNGTVRNLVAEMEALEKPESMSVYDAVCILPVYQYGSCKQGDSAMAPSALIDLILANADDKGLFGFLTYGCDMQTTAQAILALLPYQSFHSGAAAAIKKAESALLSMENEDGSFAYSAQYREANLDATANVVAALEAIGYNCASDSRLTTSNGSMSLGYLTSVAEKDLTGYLDASSYNESAASAVVLMAFAAHEGARQADGVYSVYTFKQVTKDDSNSGSNQDSGSNSDSDVKPLAQTGDDAATAAAAAIALCALASGAVAFVAVFASIGYATGLFGSAQPDEQVAQQQAQEQPASASSTSVKQSTSGQPDNSQDGGDKASSAEDGKAKDENSSTDSSQEQSEGSSSEQASQSDASSGGVWGIWLGGV